MKKAHLYYMLLIINLALFSCKKDAVQPDPVPPDPPKPAYKTKDIQVELPAEARLDLATLSVHSLSVNTSVGADGKSAVAFNKGYPHIAYVFDQQNRMLLAGFLTDSTAKINTQSTAKVLLYFGYATLMDQFEMTAEFLNQIHTIKHVPAWYAKFDALFKQDPLVLDKGSFREHLKLALQEISNGRMMTSGRKQNSAYPATAQKSITDITILNNNQKSGIRAHSNELSKILIDNDYRRRAHAFLYKVKTKTGNSTINTPIESNSITQDDKVVDPAGGVTSVSGVLGAWIEGKESEFTTVTSGPFEVMVDEGVDEAEYKLRLIGPGMIGTNKTISDQEAAKLTQLEIETLALDFLLPVMLEVVGNRDDLALIDGSRHFAGPIEDFLEATTVVLKLTPGCYEEIRKGNYDMALRKLLEGLYTEGFADQFENLVKFSAAILEMLAQQRYYIPSQVDLFKEVEQKTKILKLIDLGLFASDIARMGKDILMSNQVEEWDVIAKAPKVTLLPGIAEVVPLQQQKITCEIKNMAETGGDTHPFFEWRTSGKWGKLSDTKGHTNLASFASADRDVFYYSNARLEDLSDDDNYDTIFVVAKFGSLTIGRDTMLINVKKETTTFTVGLTGHIHAWEVWDDFYHAIMYKGEQPYYTAEFKHREGAKSYSIKIVRKDGTKGTPTIYAADNTWIKDGIFNYRLRIGSVRLFESLSKEKYEAEKARQQKLLDDTGHQAIEVTVNY